MKYSQIELQHKIRQEIPLCDAMDLIIEELSENKIVISAPMTANKNSHGSFFAGSIYSLSAITGWGLLTNYAHTHFIGSGVVVRKANVDYFHPITDTKLTLTAEMPDATIMEPFIQRLDEKGRARLNLSIDILSDEKLAVQFSGAYTVLKNGHAEIVKGSE